MNKFHKLKTLGAVLLLVVLFTGCQLMQSDFNASGYIEAMLNSTYKADNHLYIGLTGASSAEADENHQTTVANAVTRFFEKYEANPSESQATALSAILSAAYKQSSYSVAEKVVVTGGYTVAVSFTPMTNLADISAQILTLQNDAGAETYDLGADYIDDMIDLCETALVTPTFGTTQTITFPLRIADNGDVSLDMRQFAEIDNAIFPL